VWATCGRFRGYPQITVLDWPMPSFSARRLTHAPSVRSLRLLASALASTIQPADLVALLTNVELRIGLQDRSDEGGA
jgi:hypothetical protein